METTPNQGFPNQSQQQSPLEVTRLSILSTLRVRPLPHAENTESAEVRPLREGPVPYGTGANGDNPPLGALTECTAHPRQHPSYTRVTS